MKNIVKVALQVTEKDTIFCGRYTIGVTFLSKMVYKRVRGLDLGAEPPRIKLC